jgi:MerR family transcriptional regulator, copper efflux regulator
MSVERLTVSEAAKRTGLSPRALRLYEARGLLPSVRRTEAGYRIYTDHDLQLLRFIRQSRAVGLRLAEIRQIIDLRRDGTPPGDEVLALLQRRLREIDEKMSALQSLRHTLGEVMDVVRTNARRGEEVRLCRVLDE